MTSTEIRQLADEDSRLAVGTPVIVRWGYGSGFRAEGRGRIVKVNAKSVRVELDEDVMLRPGIVSWHKGFVLQGIARFAIWGGNWDWWNSVSIREG